MSSVDQDHLLDHNYDGIQEYDNPLPGWWVAVFWVTIIFSVIYPLYYHMGIGPLVQDDYEASAVRALEQQAAELAGMDISEGTISGLMADGQAMKGMRSKFVLKCATCHHDSGRGDACPNLTDDHWIHGGSLVNIYETIRDGVEGKEMQSWLGDLGPGGVLAMAAYVGTLRGTHASGGKKAEGELYKPSPEEPKPPGEGD